MLKNKKIDLRLELESPLTEKQVNLYNSLAKSKNIMLVFKNTKGLQPEIIEKLNDNIIISIQGGLAPTEKRPKFAAEIYQERTYYTKNELIAIIKIFEKIEAKINPDWSELEKAMFVYKQLCESLTYDNFFIWERYDTDNYEDWEKRRGMRAGYLKGDGSLKRVERGNSIQNLLGLISGRSMCAGFALIYKEAMDRLGIKCHYQNKKGGHCWNVLEIDGICYGIDLSDDTSKKKNNECQFLMFGTQTGSLFYTWKDHRNIYGDSQETVFDVKTIEPSTMENMKKKISEDKKNSEKEISITEETHIIAGHKITIKNNIPMTEDPLMTFVRDDKTVFVLIPTGNEQDDLYEYIYAEYDVKTKQINTLTIYSETKIQSFNLELRAAIANNLLSKERLEYRLENYNGYVGYLYNNKIIMGNYEREKRTIRR